MPTQTDTNQNPASSNTGKHADPQPSTTTSRTVDEVDRQHRQFLNEIDKLQEEVAESEKVLTYAVTTGDEKQRAATRKALEKKRAELDELHRACEYLKTERQQALRVEQEAEDERVRWRCKKLLQEREQLCRKIDDQMKVLGELCDGLAAIDRDVSALSGSGSTLSARKFAVLNALWSNCPQLCKLANIRAPLSRAKIKPLADAPPPAASAPPSQQPQAAA